MNPGSAPIVIALAIATIGAGMPLSGALVTDAMQSQPTSSHADPSILPMISVDVQGYTNPQIGHDSVIKATVVSNYYDLMNVTIEAENPDSVATTPTLIQNVKLSRGEANQFEFSISPSAPGEYLITIYATSFHQEAGTVVGRGLISLSVPEYGVGTFELGPSPIQAPPAESGVKFVHGPVNITREAVSGQISQESGASGPDNGSGSLATPSDPVPLTETGATTVNESSGSQSPPATQSSDTFRVHVCWVYQNRVDGWNRQRWAMVEVWEKDLFNHGSERIDYGLTASFGPSSPNRAENGCFTSRPLQRADSDWLDWGNVDIFLKFKTCWSVACVRVPSWPNPAYVWTTEHEENGLRTVGDNEDPQEWGTISPGANEWATRAYQYVNNAWNYTTNSNAGNFPTSDLGGVRILMPSSITGSCGRYSEGDNTIHLVVSDDCNVDRSPDVVIHEYGHFLMDKAYGDMDDLPGPGGSHFFCEESQDPGLSWREGFADFFGVLVNYESFPTLGTDGDTKYYRHGNPVTKKNRIDRSMENSTTCPDPDPEGFDNELNVAGSLWDLRDTTNEGLDVSSESIAFILGVLNTCQHDTFRQYYDGGNCNWLQQGGNQCNMIRAAEQNRVPFNTAPTAQVVTQTAFAWYRDSMFIWANSDDPDACGPGLYVDFYVSHDSTCDGNDIKLGRDWTAEYRRTFNIEHIADDPSVWTCARGYDEMDLGPFARSQSHVGIDNTAPSTSIILGGTSGANGWYKSSVTVWITCSDATSGVSKITYQVDGGTSKTYTGYFTISKQGYSTVSATCTDNAGNTDSTSKTFKIDTRPPSTTHTKSGTLGNNGWYTSSVTVNLACSDPTPGSGCHHSRTRVDSGSWVRGSSRTISSDGNHRVDYKSRDYAGNWETYQTTWVKIDQTPPSQGIPLSGQSGTNGWYVSTVEVTLDCADSASGVQSVTYQLDGGSTTTYTGPFDVSSQGSHTVSATCTDYAGHQDMASKTFKIDSIDPGHTSSTSGTQGDNGWYLGSVSVTLSCADPGTVASGVKAITYSLDGGTVQTYTGPFTVSAEGSTSVASACTDYAGNTATRNTIVKIDTTTPTVDLTLDGTAGDNGWYTSGVTVTLSCVDPSPGSGATTMTYTVDGGTTKAYSAPFTISDDGAHTVEATCQDEAGHKDSRSKAVHVDQTSPGGTLEAPLISQAAYNVNWTASDAMSGLWSVEVQEKKMDAMDSNSWETACALSVSGASASGTCERDPSSTGQYCYRLIVTDAAGNTYISDEDVCVTVEEVEGGPVIPAP